MYVALEDMTSKNSLPQELFHSDMFGKVISFVATHIVQVNSNSNKHFSNNHFIVVLIVHIINI